MPEMKKTILKMIEDQNKQQKQLIYNKMMGCLIKKKKTIFTIDELVEKLWLTKQDDSPVKQIINKLIRQISYQFVLRDLPIKILTSK